jgi:putative transposase
VNQLYARYRRDGSIPSLKSAGRPTIDIPLEERVAIRNAKRRFGVGACYLVPIVKRFYGMDTNHMRVYRVLKEDDSLSFRARRYIRRKWIRYEREYSNELWHTDWHDMKHPAYEGKHLIVYEDDASRCIMGYGLFDTETSSYSVEVLDRATREHEKPRSVLSDRGSTFYAVEAEAREKGLTEFELYLMRNHIAQTLSGVRHPETNGKLEKLFDTIEGGLEKGFFPIEECIFWYNCMKPHGALDLERAETPIEAYYRKMRPRDKLIDPSILIQQGREMIL